MSDYWKVNGIETDGLVGPQAPLTVGETVDYPFLFRPRQSPAPGHIERYEAVRELGLASGQFDTYETLNGEWYFKENGGDISPLIGIVPPDRDPTARRVWGLIEGYGDDTTLADKRCELSLSVLLLSVGDTYTTESALRADREVPGL